MIGVVQGNLGDLVAAALMTGARFSALARLIVLAFASIANPLIAIVMRVQRHYGAAVLLGVFSVWSWLFTKSTLSDLIKRRRRR